MFKENCKSPLFSVKVKEKPYNSISKIKSKRIVLPLLHDISTENKKEKRSLFSFKTNTSNENKIILKKIDSNLTEFSPPKVKKLSKPSSRRSSRIGIESNYHLKKKNKSNINFVDFEENSSKRTQKKRFNSHRKLYVKSKKEIEMTEDTKKNISFSKLPLIDTNMFNLKDHQQLNNQVINKTKHKFQSEKKLSLNFDFKGIDYSTQTRMGEIENGIPKDNNQDASIILKNVCGICSYDIYGIMDGHGSNGHLVSNFVKNKVNEYFNNKKIYKIKDFNKTNSFKEKNDFCHIIYDKLKQDDYALIKNFYKQTNDELYDTKFDVHFSGTTCVLVFKIGKKIICSNVGDSRAIMAERKFTFDEKTNEIINKYEVIELSHDHKPNRKEERERIEKSGGEVDQEFLNETDEKSDLPFRVWKKGCDYPGLAVSRSLGDKIAEEIGVISEPEIIEIDINKNSKYIIMGSDGIFEYLTNNDVVEISKKYLNNDNLQKACVAVVEKATKLFKEKENRVDDITINIINI